MNNLLFVWDKEKNRLTQKKHRVSFDEAKTVFFEELAVEFADPDHSSDEDRFILLEFSLKSRVLIVCYCYREKDTAIRIISSRKATKQEHLYYLRRHYENRI